MTVLFIFGTRPEAIKMAPVILELQSQGQAVRPVVCVTAQHREMLDQVMQFFHIEPNIDLDLMTDNQSLAGFASKAIAELDGVVQSVQPHVILVQGDATSAMAGALAGFYHKVPVGHVEAGLRTGDKYVPYPEEMNRRIISAVAEWHFAPTRHARTALLKEGVGEKSIYVTGNTVIDALLLAKKRVRRTRRTGFAPNGQKVILLTAHRRESFGHPLAKICQAVISLIRRNDDIEIVYPVHPNPSVRDAVRRMLRKSQRVHLCEPLGYEQLVELLVRSYLVLTDSGGIQEEAPAVGKPVLVLRDKTERVEAVRAGAAKLVGTEPETIVSEVERLLRDRHQYLKMARAVSPYGDGRAAKRIARIVLGGEGDEFHFDSHGFSCLRSGEG